MAAIKARPLCKPPMGITVGGTKPPHCRSTLALGWRAATVPGQANGPPPQRLRTGRPNDGGQGTSPCPLGRDCIPHFPVGEVVPPPAAVRLSLLGRPPLGVCAPSRFSGGGATLSPAPVGALEGFFFILLHSPSPLAQPCPRPHGRVPPGWFHALLTPLSRCFSQFPHGTCALSVFCLII